MAPRLGQTLASRIPQPVVGREVDELLGRPIGDRQAAAGADRRDRWPDLPGHALHRAANLREMLEVCSRPYVHVHARYRELVPGRQCESFAEPVVPDAVLGMVAAGVRLLAVSVTETGVDAQRDVAPGARRPSWSIMSGEPTFTWTPRSTASERASSSKMSAVYTTGGGSPSGWYPAANERSSSPCSRHPRARLSAA